MANFIFQFGKHKGKTLEWVEKNDKSYITWARQNAPKLLIPPKEKISPPPISTHIIMEREQEQQAIRPNLNFHNEGPAEICKEYLKKQK